MADGIGVQITRDECFAEWLTIGADEDTSGRGVNICGILQTSRFHDGSFFFIWAGVWFSLGFDGVNDDFWVEEVVAMTTAVAFIVDGIVDLEC